MADKHSIDWTETFLLWDASAEFSHQTPQGSTLPPNNNHSESGEPETTLRLHLSVPQPEALSPIERRIIFEEV
jgi:hypothetical protein